MIMIHSRIESPSVLLIQGMHMKVLVRYIGTGCIFGRIESPSVLIQGMHMKVLIRYIGTGCIFCAPSGL